MIGLALSMMLCAFQPTHGEDVWEEIAAMELFIQQSLTRENNQVGILRSDPVRGYYAERTGVVLVIPIRHRGGVDMARQTEEKKLPAASETTALNRREIQKKVRDWKEKLQKSELIKDANFEKVVTQLRDMIPQIFSALSQLPTDEKLTLIIEERAPAWYYAGFSLIKEPTRKIVTLTVENGEPIHANETVRDGDWSKRIKRTTVNRKLYSLVP